MKYSVRLAQNGILFLLIEGNSYCFERSNLALVSKSNAHGFCISALPLEGLSPTTDFFFDPVLFTMPPSSALKSNLEGAMKTQLSILDDGQVNLNTAEKIAQHYGVGEEFAAIKEIQMTGKSVEDFCSLTKEERVLLMPIYRQAFRDVIATSLTDLKTAGEDISFLTCYETNTVPVTAKRIKNFAAIEKNCPSEFVRCIRLILSDLDLLEE